MKNYLVAYKRVLRDKSYRGSVTASYMDVETSTVSAESVADAKKFTEYNFRDDSDFIEVISVTCLED